jgi:hypothetical protein
MLQMLPDKRLLAELLYNYSGQGDISTEGTLTS